jgi:hypothetical protein
MENLPVELVQQILTHLDLESLKDAALSCRVLLSAFKGAEDLITGEILLSQIDQDVLPEAILVNASWHLRGLQCSKPSQFARKNLQSRKPAPSKWTLAQALPLARFHKYVSHFASIMALEALGKQHGLLGPGEQSALPCEMQRFERALYRFQLYCNIVGKSMFWVDEDLLKDRFFGYFAAWENEQLACVHDFLVRHVAKCKQRPVASYQLWANGVNM